MFFDKRNTSSGVNTRSFKDVVKEKTGSGIAEGLGGIVLLMMVAGSISLGVATDMKAVQTLSVKTERQSMVTALVDDRRAGATWGTAAAPTTEMVTLENGRKTEVTMWREVTPVGVNLSAVTAISADPDAANCKVPADIEKSGCIYAHRFHAGDMNSVSPGLTIFKSEGTTAAKIVGTVDMRVGISASIAQGTTFATGKDATATSWRYLLSASSVEDTGEIRISQNGRILATIQVDKTLNNYFGTFSVEPNVPVTMTVTQGNVIVKTAMSYRAGGSR